MKKIISIIMAVFVMLSLVACNTTKPEEPVEPETKQWTREGAYEDGTGNYLTVSYSDTEGYEGWAVSLILGDETFGWIIQQEGEVLKGNLNAWDEKLKPFNVTICEDGEEGLKVEVEGGKTYSFTEMEMPEAKVVVTANVTGFGYVAYGEGEETPELDPEFRPQSAYIGLAEPAVYTFVAHPEVGNIFVKWTKDGEDYSTEPQITLSLEESTELVAVFEQDPNWQNPVMNVIGDYVCDRANAKVECFGFDQAFITIDWASSASEVTRWILVGKLDTETMTITYDNGTKSNLTFDENGEIKEEETVYIDGTGTITFNEDGTFTWHEDQSDREADLIFE
jgi:hypothetical protein